MKFENESFWTNYNQNTSAVRWDKAKEITKYLNDNYKSLEKDEASILIWEKNITDLQPSRENGQRFGPMFTLKDAEGKPSSYPDIEKDFSEESFMYYESRVKIVSNPILKARYCDVLLTLKKKYEYANDAITSYLQAAEVYFENKWDSELVDALERSLEIACSIKQKEKIEKTLQTMKSVAAAMIKLHQPRYIIEIVEAILRLYKNCEEFINLDDLISWANASVEYYKLNINSDLEREFLKVKINILKKQKKSDEIIATQRQIVESHVQDAETMVSQPMISKNSYEKALSMMEIIGASQEEKDALKVKIESLSGKAPETFKTIETTIEVPREKIDKAREDFLKIYNGKALKDKIGILSIDHRLILPVDSYLKDAQEQLSNSLMGHIPQEIYSAGFVVKKTTGLEENVEHWANMMMFMGYDHLLALHLIPFFNDLYKTEASFIEDLTSFVTLNPHFMAERSLCFSSAIKNYFSKDYVSVLHILPFLIEGMVRDLIRAMKIPTIKYEKGIGSVRGLDPLLNIFEKIPGADKNFCHLIRYSLITDGYKNLRDATAHALLEQEQYNEQNAMLLLFVCIKLSGLRVENVQPS